MIRRVQVGLVGMLSLLMLGTGCGAQGSTPKTSDPPAPPPAVLVLPCGEGDQTMVMWDVAGPGQPSPEEAVRPHVGALRLVTQKVDGETTVVGMLPDGTVARVFDVTKSDDGWWPDGYRTCS